MKNLLLLFVVLSLVVYFSLVPSSGGDQSLWGKLSLTDSGFFKHVFGYFVVGLSLYTVFKGKTIWACLGCLLAFSVFLEVLQYFFPTRSFNVLDILANILGVFLVSLIVIFHKKWEKRSYRRIKRKKRRLKF